MTEAPSYANDESLEGPARRLSSCLRPVPRDAALLSIRRRYQNMDWSSHASASHAASPNAATTGCSCSARDTLSRILFLFCRPSVAVLPSVLFMLTCGAPARNALKSVLKTTWLCCCKLLLREGGAQQVMGCAEGRTESTEREPRHETPQVDVTQEVKSRTAMRPRATADVSTTVRWYCLRPAPACGLYGKQTGASRATAWERNASFSIFAAPIFVTISPTAQVALLQAAM